MPDTVLIGDTAYEGPSVLFEWVLGVDRNTPVEMEHWGFHRHFETANILFVNGTVEKRRREDVLKRSCTWWDEDLHPSW